METVNPHEIQRKQRDQGEVIIRDLGRIERIIEISRVLLEIGLALIAVETIALIALIVRFLF